MHQTVRTAVARLRENGISGTVHFSQRRDGVLVSAHMEGLPASETDFFAFHIHEGRDCQTPGLHYDPVGVKHPLHAGDLPPLLRCGGKAYLSFLTDRFRLQAVIGRTVVIHGGSDDFHSQPSGNPGPMIACGEIVPVVF